MSTREPATDARRRLAPQTEDPLRTCGRFLFYLGIVTLPWLAIRVHQVTISDALFALSLVCVLLSRPFASRKPGNPAISLGVYLALLGAVASEFRDTDVSSGVATILRLLFVWGIWAWQAKQLLDTRRHVERAVGLFALGCAVAGLAALGQYRFELVIPGAELTNTFRASGLAQHPNDLGGALAIGLVVCFAAITMRRGRARWLWLTAAVCCAIGLVLAGTVTGMLAALAGLGAVLVVRRFSVKALLLSGLGLAAAGWVALGLQSSSGTGAGSGLSPLERFVVATGGGTATQDTTSDRLNTWAAAWDRVAANPFIGVGFSDEQTKVVGETLTHNMLLGFWLAGGLLTLVGVCVIWLAALRDGLRVELSFARTQLLPAMIASFGFAMTAPITYQRYAWLPVMMLVALATASPGRKPITPLAGRDAAPGERPQPTPESRRRSGVRRLPARR